MFQIHVHRFVEKRELFFSTNHYGVFDNVVGIYLKQVGLLPTLQLALGKYNIRVSSFESSEKSKDREWAILRKLT